MNPLELWAGVEPSGVRVGDTYADQLEWTGHASRLDDIDRLAALGAKAVRYPVLWERTLQDDGTFSWSFADERLGRLRDLGIRPIVGLVHHGSGPRHTSLLEDSFVGGLAEFARAVAERYPWITDYTPVNEPLTTARFSALYGHWYPHAKDARSFLRALLVECRAVRAAMRAIREVVPEARLIQTEDFGTVRSTDEVAYQADFENHRRFLSLDLLAGRVTSEHPLRPWASDNGIDAAALEDFAADPCSPDVIGINYYVTSDRFLDHRCERYPSAIVGSNGKHAYADVEAVRVRGVSLAGHRVALEELWQRYRLPLAITEVHLGASSEDQIRWLHEAWLSARDAQESGVDVRAVTLWSAFGCFDWDSLLRVRNGHYEPGAFDIRGRSVRPTALASVARQLATTGACAHPLLRDAGWWRRVDRIQYPRRDEREPRVLASSGASPPVLVIGSCPILLQEIERVCLRRNIGFAIVRDLQGSEPSSMRACAAIEHYRPWAVIDATSDLGIDGVPGEHARRFQGDVARAAVIARACHARGIRHVAFSSDLVFDGTKGRAYVEADAIAPFNGFGQSKAIAERAIQDVCPDAIVLRTGTLFGHGQGSDPVAAALDAMLAGRSVADKIDDVLSPTYVADAAEAMMTLLVDGANGVWHLSCGTAVTWTELARSLAALAKLEEQAIDESPSAAARARRWRALASERGALLRGLDETLAIYVAEWRARRP